MRSANMSELLLGAKPVGFHFVFPAVAKQVELGEQVGRLGHHHHGFGPRRHVLG